MINDFKPICIQKYLIGKSIHIRDEQNLEGLTGEKFKQNLEGLTGEKFKQNLEGITEPTKPSRFIRGESQQNLEGIAREKASKTLNV